MQSKIQMSFIQIKVKWREFIYKKNNFYYIMQKFDKKLMID